MPRAVLILGNFRITSSKVSYPWTWIFQDKRLFPVGYNHLGANFVCPSNSDCGLLISWTSNVKSWSVQNTIGWFINNLIKLLSFIKQTIFFKKNIWILIFWHKIFEFLVSHPLLPISGLRRGVLARVRPNRLILIYLLLMIWKFTCSCSTMLCLLSYYHKKLQNLTVEPTLSRSLAQQRSASFCPWASSAPVRAPIRSRMLMLRLKLCHR